MTGETPELLDDEGYVAGRAGIDLGEAVEIPTNGEGESVAWICVTCGVQYAPTPRPIDVCPTCSDDRQYVGWRGQEWTTMNRLLQTGRRNVFREEEPGLTSIETEPATAIGQRAMLIKTDSGNYLWDCITMIDDATAAEIERRGGLQAIAISHPHFYSSMVTWAERFDVSVMVHEADRDFVRYPSDRIVYWPGDSYDLGPGLTIVKVGGHFPGSSVLVWSAGADGKGVLMAGDSVKPVMDRRYVSFMYSIVNLIPLPVSRVRDIVARLDPYEFDRIYSLWRDHVVDNDAKAAVRRSAERYIRHLEED